MGADERRATYTNLPAGEYTFQVLGSNHRGIWNETGTSVRVTLLPPWWQTLWFRTAAMITVVALLFAAHRLRVKYFVETDRRLEEEIQKRKTTERTLARTASKLIYAQEDERRRIARDLHDGVSQRIAAVAMGLQQVAKDLPEDKEKDIVAIENEVIDVSDEVRRISHDLHPSLLEHLGLVTALEKHCTNVAEHEDLRIDFHARDIPESLHPVAEASLYRIAQECLQNVVKHARATRVEVTLEGVDSGILLRVEDDGAGFDSGQSPGSGGLGLVSMEERVRPLKGRFVLHSEPGKGTRIEVWIPVEDGGATPRVENAVTEPS
ncbi:MAG: sensor histidine kinase [Acidobacteria bacterium]|nr:MAG: sensor histidine kinase [Acidobacteriota bacterium]